MFSSRGSSVLKICLFLMALMDLIRAQQQQQQDTLIIKQGRYIPELYGADLGKYIPDDSGKYYHIHRPYDGGYGDTGIKYVHDISGNLVPISSRNLGPKDHLRFMIDFNYDNSGWQVINFEWLRDGDENYKFNYVNENQLFSNNEVNDSDTQTGSDNSDSRSDSEIEQNNNESDGHVDGEYNDNNEYNYSYNNDNLSNKNSKDLQKAMREVIYYIENHIIPTL